MTMKKDLLKQLGVTPAGQRGPAEHDRRAQIVAAADEYFRHYGYNKTTVADLAKAIKLSTAYIYKFFDSKQAIGEAVCSQCVGSIIADLRKISRETKPAADRLRRMHKNLGKLSVKLFFNDRKLHDIVGTAVRENWSVHKTYQAEMFEMIVDVVTQGRELGEFEQTMPLIKTCNAIAQTFLLAWHPVLLEEHLDEIDERSNDIMMLVLRGLAA